MCTDKYLEIVYWAECGGVFSGAEGARREVVAIENNTSRAKRLSEKLVKKRHWCLVVSDGLSSRCWKRWMM